MKTWKPLFGWLGVMLVITALFPGTSQAEFGLKSVSVKALEADGSSDLQAGSHPFSYSVGFSMNRNPEGIPEGTLRDLIVELPAGLVGNPQATPTCDPTDFAALEAECPVNTQVGIAEIDVGFLTEYLAVAPVFNLTAAPGEPARIGFNEAGFYGLQEASLRPGDYGVNISDVTIPDLTINSVTETIWGVPADPRHDPERRCFGSKFGCSTDIPRLPFLTLPTSCTGPLKTRVRVDSVENAGVFDSKTVSSVNENDIAAGLENCEAPPFNPSVAVQPETEAADSPTGLHVGVHIPQSQDPDALASAHLKDTAIALPRGLVINPSAANGLSACSLEGPQGINLPKSTDPQVPEPIAVGEAAKCPPNSQVGTVAVKTPLLDHPVPGAVYLAKQFENPFHSLLALYIALDDPVSGTVVKLAGKVVPDPVTGQLRATFEDNPQLPFEDLDFQIAGGQDASLTTPSLCGAHPTLATLTPWTTPEGATVSRSSSFSITRAAAGGPCASHEAEKSNAPAFEAGTATPLAATYSPFVLKLGRENGTQHFGALNVTLPQGLVGKLAGIPYCSEAQLTQAKARSAPGQGALELAQPSCPAASELGSVTVGAGSGSPFFVGGRAYLAGPYKGAPLSIAIVTPAIAGPFDLGVVTVRAALYVDETSAQITVKSDPIPTILAGIPLDLRSIAVRVDRQGFTLNPTSCEAMAVSGQATSTTGATAPLSNRFQVGGCGGLDFKPRVAIKLDGGTKRNQHPALKAVVTYPKGAPANIARAAVTLPASEFIDPAHINNPCIRPDFAAGKCPPSSVLGRARAFSPLLDKPLEGPVYFRANGGARNIPDLVVDLHGQVHLVLVGFVDSVHKKGSEVSRIRNTFASVPDAPVSKFVLELNGGKKRGVLVNSANLCKAPDEAKVHLTAHSGKTYDAQPMVANGCKKAGAKGSAKRRLSN